MPQTPPTETNAHLRVMIHRHHLVARFSVRFLFLLLSPLLAGAHISAQTSRTAQANATATLTGAISDPAGYFIPHAKLTLVPIPTATTVSLEPRTITADDSGNFSVRLIPGPYTLSVQAAGFSDLRKNIVVALPRDKRPQVLQLILPLPTSETSVEVKADDDADTTSPERNGSAIILKPSDLAALSDDPDTLKQQLEAIAGPSPDGVHFYVDGFDAGRLPPKSQIREVRINSNQYSAQFDTPGVARIEIFTKAGGGTLHGGVWGTGANSIFNAQDPIAPQPSYSSTQLGGYLSGPLGKKLSTNLNFYRLQNSYSSLIDATVLDSNLNPVSLTQAVPNPRASTYISPRVDFEAPHGTAVSLRYNFSRDTQNEGGVGGTSLASTAYRVQNEDQTLQALITNSFGAKTVNELRFQYSRLRNNNFAVSSAPTISVQGAFTSGGASGGTTRDKLDTYEYSDYFSHVLKKAFLRVGGRFRVVHDSNYATSGFQGVYTFPTIAAYQITLNGMTQGLTPAQIRAAGGGATLFSLTAGTPSVAVARVDGDLYAEEDWKLSPKFTASLGLRLESQNVISDHLDVAPRYTMAYAVGRKGKPARFTLRAGVGVFYTRYSTGSQLVVARQNGILEQQYLVQNPDFYPSLPTPSSLGGSIPSTVTTMDPNLRAPRDLFSGVGVDIPLSKLGSFSVNYNNLHLVHAFEMRNINAPLPGTYNPAVPGSGVRPFGGTNSIYQYGSEGISGQNALRVSGGLHKGTVSLYSFYSYAFNTGNTSGGFPSNSYDQHADYGRTSNDIRHQLYLYMNATVPFGIQLNSNILVHSGTPFNITLGQDLNGDNQYNDRPTYATDLTRASVVATRWGTFDTAPIAGQKTIPINLGTNPIIFEYDQRVGRDFQFGKELPTSQQPTPVKGSKKPLPVRRRYDMGFDVYIVNVLNHANYANTSGTLSSPLFGRATGDQGPRMFNLEARFNF